MTVTGLSGAAVPAEQSPGGYTFPAHDGTAEVSGPPSPFRTFPQRANSRESQRALLTLTEAMTALALYWHHEPQPFATETTSRTIVCTRCHGYSTATIGQGEPAAIRGALTMYPCGHLAISAYEPRPDRLTLQSPELG